MNIFIGKFVQRRTLIVLAVIAFISWGVFVQPSIRPEEITVKGTLFPSGNSQQEPDNWKEDWWVLKLTVDKSTNLPLMKFPELGNGWITRKLKPFLFGHWEYEVLPFAAGRQVVGLKIISGSPAGVEGQYSLGTNGNLYMEEFHELDRHEYYDIARYSNLPSIKRFSYTGKKFPAEVLLALEGNQEPAEDTSLLVVAYHEERLGKTFSWAKIVPVQIVH